MNLTRKSPLTQGRTLQSLYLFGSSPKLFRLRHFVNDISCRTDLFGQRVLTFVFCFLRTIDICVRALYLLAQMSFGSYLCDFRLLFLHSRLLYCLILTLSFYRQSRFWFDLSAVLLDFGGRARFFKYIFLRVIGEHMFDFM